VCDGVLQYGMEADQRAEAPAGGQVFARRRAFERASSHSHMYLTKKARCALVNVGTVYDK
jgi:hypothetical protein